MPAFVLPILALLQAVGPTAEVSRLDNGLRVVIVPDSREPLVSVQLWFRAGSADDGTKYPGLCEVARCYLEHFPDVPAPLRAADVRLESCTLPDACYFAWFLPPPLLDAALQLEAQRLRCPAVDAERVAAAVEAAGRAASGYEEPQRRLLAAAFAGHPYQSPPGLVTDSLKGVSPVEVQEFLQRWFVPGNATLLVIGDVQPPAVRDATRRHFGGLPWAEPRRRARWPLPAAEPVRLPPLPAEHAGLDVAWVAPAAGSEDSVALAVLMQRLCNPVDGPLYRRLTEAGCLPPRWSQEAWHVAGLVVLSVDAPEEATQGTGELDTLIQEELGRATQTIPTEIELDRARALAARAVRLQRGSFADRAVNLGFYEVVAGDLRLVEWELPRIGQLTVGDLQRAAADLCKARTVCLPRVARLGEGMSIRAADAAPDPTPAGAPQTLLDGVHVTVCTQPGVALVEVRTVVTGETGVAEALDALMAVGSTRHSVEQIRDYLTYHGLDLFPLAGGSRPGLISRGPATHVAQMVELHAELLRHPNADPAVCEVACEHGRRLQRWLREARDPERLWYVPPGFIGWRAAVTPPADPSVLRTTLDVLKTIRSVEVTVTGDIDGPGVHGAVRAAWEDWRPHTGTQPAPPSRYVQPRI